MYGLVHLNTLVPLPLHCPCLPATTVARKYDHVSPLLKQLHWLPVSKRIMYKVALIVYKSIHSLTPQYISCLLNSPVQQSRYSLRSRTDPHLLKIPYINTCILFNCLLYALGEQIKCIHILIVIVKRFEHCFGKALYKYQ